MHRHGDDELKAGKVKVKDLAKREEVEVDIDTAADELVRRGVRPGVAPSFAIGADVDTPLAAPEACPCQCAAPDILAAAGCCGSRPSCRN